MNEQQPQQPQPPANVRPIADGRRQREAKQSARQAEEQASASDVWSDVGTFLPQNVEAEAGVLGSILIDPDALPLVRECGLASEHFYREAHRLVYAAMCALDQRAEPVDLLTVADALAQSGHLEAVGGTAAVSGLANHVPTAAHASAYARRVVRLATARAYIQTAGQLAALAYNDPESADLHASAQALILDVAAQATVGGSVSLASAIDEHLAEVLAIGEGQVVGLRTGFSHLDALTGGVFPGEMAIVCARPGVGKSTFGVQVALAKAEALAAAGEDGTVEYVTLEMPARQQAKRLLTNLAGQDGRLVRRGFLRRDGDPASFDLAAWDHYNDVGHALSTRLGQRVWLRDRSVALGELRTHLTLAVRQRACRVAIIDYVGLVRSENTRATDYQRMSEIARELKQLARDLNIVVVALCQFSRDLERRQSHRPMLADLRDTGEWEQSADFVLALHRPCLYDAGRAADGTAFAALTEVLILKARESIPNTWVPLWFQAAFTRLSDWPAGVPIPEDETRPDGTHARAQHERQESEGYETW